VLVVKFRTFIVLFGVLVFPGVVQAAWPLPYRVGQIFVIGAVATPQTFVLRQAPLYPGQLVSASDFRAAERNLRRFN
jgi:outer membrane protein assembly factor BamA